MNGEDDPFYLEINVTRKKKTVVYGRSTWREQVKFDHEMAVVVILIP